MCELVVHPQSPMFKYDVVVMFPRLDSTTTMNMQVDKTMTVSQVKSAIVKMVKSKDENTPLCESDFSIKFKGKILWEEWRRLDEGVS